MDSSVQEDLRLWARDFGVNLSAFQIHLFDIFLEELWKWNKQMNLTGLNSRQKILRELLLDSLIPSAFLPEVGRLLDVGSGAGFPGIPLKICKPSLTTHLMEANSKKTSFLKQIIRLTKLEQIDVIRGRIEKDGSLLHPEGYHVITVRALAPLSNVLQWCAPHLKSRGMLANFQGSRFNSNLEESSDAMKRNYLALYKSIPYSLPGKNSQRYLLIFIKHDER